MARLVGPLFYAVAGVIAAILIAMLGSVIAADWRGEVSDWLGVALAGALTCFAVLAGVLLWRCRPWFSE